MGERASREVENSKHQNTVRPESSKTAPQTPAASSRLTPIPVELDVGEQVIGSSHVFELASPFNIGREAAQIEVSIAGAGFSIEAAPKRLAPTNGMSSDDLSTQLSTPIRIRFAPTQRRWSAADLEVRASWSDGTTETTRTHVVGRARGLEDTPSPGPKEIAEARQQEAEAANGRAQNEQLDRAFSSNRSVRPHQEWAMDQLNGARDDARRAASALARQQHAGVEVVIEEIGTFKPPPTPPNVWWELAKLALTLGTGALGDFVAKGIARTLGEEILGAAKDSALVSGLGASIRAGLTSGAKSAIETLAPTSDAAEVSSNARVAFFETQLQALNIAASNNEALVDKEHKHLTLRIDDDPHTALGAMRAIASGLEAALPSANVAQKHATAVEWLAYKARLKLGTEELADKHRVAKLDRARMSRHPTPDGFDGLLDVVVDLEHGPAHVVSARAPGIARALADHIARTDLASANVPMRILVGWNEPEPTIITRDEAGRVRVSGNFSRLTKVRNDGIRVDSEVQAELAATELVSLVLSRSLAAWQVELSTNDHSRGDE